MCTPSGVSFSGVRQRLFRYGPWQIGYGASSALDAVRGLIKTLHRALNQDCGLFIANTFCTDLVALGLLHLSVSVCDRFPLLEQFEECIGLMPFGASCRRRINRAACPSNNARQFWVPEWQSHASADRAADMRVYAGSMAPQRQTIRSTLRLSRRASFLAASHAYSGAH